MLGFLFGFNARIGRAHYFLSLAGLGAAMGVIIYVVTGAALQNPREIAQLISFAKGWPAMIVGVVFLWVTLTLQSMRFRDMGWDPVCVIPGWIALLIVDRLVAVKVPAVSLGPESQQTAVGVLVHFGLILALTFWPSAGADTPDAEQPRRRSDVPARRGPTSIAAQRMARISGGN